MSKEPKPEGSIADKEITIIWMSAMVGLVAKSLYDNMVIRKIFGSTGSRRHTRMATQNRRGTCHSPDLDPSAV
jgi:hypothetical protein